MQSFKEIFPCLRKKKEVTPISDIDVIKISVVNTADSGLSDQQVEPIVAALQIQVDRDFSPIWHTGGDLTFVPAGHNPAAGTWQLFLLGNSDVAGALGYHDLTPSGLPIGKIFCKTDKQYNETVSVTTSHELLEMLGDPYINLTAQANDGKFYAYETADAVEADSLGYYINGVLVSDFVTPAWFGGALGKVDFKSHLSKAFQLAPGGYISVFDPSNNQGWTQITDDKAPQDYSPRAKVGSRRERRSTPRNQWLLSTYKED